MPQAQAADNDGTQPAPRIYGDASAWHRPQAFEPLWAEAIPLPAIGVPQPAFVQASASPWQPPLAALQSHNVRDDEEADDCCSRTARFYANLPSWVVPVATLATIGVISVGAYGVWRHINNPDNPDNPY